MELTVKEALDLLRRQADQVKRARERADFLEETRDALIRELDGQPGMLRREMAEALGVSKQRILVIAGKAKPAREAVLDGVPMDEQLYAELVAVVGQFARTHRDAEAVRLDVHA